MNGRAPKNLVASVRDRLRTLARQQREDYNFILMRYSNERFLHRLSRSLHRRDFVLINALVVACKWPVTHAVPNISSRSECI